MLVLLQFEQKLLSNMWFHRWLTLFCFSCTLPICQRIRRIHYTRMRGSSQCACDWTVCVGFNVWTHVVCLYVVLFWHTWAPVAIPQMLNLLSGCGGKSRRDGRGSRSVSSLPRFHCILTCCSKTQIMDQVELHSQGTCIARKGGAENWGGGIMEGKRDRRASFYLPPSSWRPTGS